MNKLTEERRFAIWHPEHKFGLPNPTLYEKQSDAITSLSGTGLWPLKHGWKLIEIELRYPAGRLAISGKADSEDDQPHEA